MWDVVKKVTAGFVLQAKEKSVNLTLQGRLWEEDVTVSERAQFANLHVVGDSGRMSQILRNIVSNALKV
jgi:signal transduction histidine kinase